MSSSIKWSFYLEQATRDDDDDDDGGDDDNEDCEKIDFEFDEQDNDSAENDAKQNGISTHYELF